MSTEIQKKFGTFLGVFLPSILTVLGLIMYLRFGWVVGNLGLGGTIAIVILANIITFITGLSASAIATNIDVGVGGVYYLVSRSLGLETGGAIGVAFYISRTLSITFYAYGLAESVLIFWPEAWGMMDAWVLPAFSAAIILLITAVSAKSASLVLKFQVPMLILVVLSIVALTIGVFTNELRAPEWMPTYRSVEGGFWVVFAVFFPGVTGFLAGIAMSGDLKDPGKSIPEGTIRSVIVGALVYMLIPILLSITALVSLDDLSDPEFGIASWTEVAIFGGLFIYPAAWGAILSSAIGSVLSGPRVLQSLSMDGLAPKFLSRTSKTGQPQIATWVTGAIALAAVFLGSLNTVAKFVTVLFLTLYVVINLVAALEKLVAEPSYRPKINIPWYISMVGALGALFVMYLISPLALLLAISLELICYLYFKKKALEQSWGDVNAGFWMRIARFSLLRMNSRPMAARNWRPLILVYVKNVNDRIELVKLAAAFGQNRGVLSISKLILAEHIPAQNELFKELQQMQDDLKKHDLQAFCEINVVDDINRGIRNVSKGHGIAGLKTNTIMFGWSGYRESNINQLRIMPDLAYQGMNIILAKFNTPDTWEIQDHKNIDIWWGGRERNGDLMLILAYMLQLNRTWENARINIRAVVDSMEAHAEMTLRVQQSLAKARIDASLQLYLSEDMDFETIMKDESNDADLVFVGLKRLEKDDNPEVLAAFIERVSSTGGICVFVQNNTVVQRIPKLFH